MSLTGPKDYLKLGSHNVLCDRCGYKYKAEDLRKEWQGFMVCHTCFEPRHPQDLIRSVRDQRPKAYYRPEPMEVFVDYTTPGGPFLADENGNILTDEYGNYLKYETP